MWRTGNACEVSNEIASPLRVGVAYEHQLDSVISRSSAKTSCRHSSTTHFHPAILALSSSTSLPTMARREIDEAAREW